MLEFQILFQRRRKTLVRAAALFMLGLAGLLLVLPRADAHDTRISPSAGTSFLLSPEPLSSERFAVLTPLMHR